MDDVAYLRQHASEESFLFVVDSAKRDKAVYPQPNEYEVHFNAPFRNVVGVDLIDATVPRTEYLVEDGSNALAYTHAGRRYQDSVPPGDYNVLQLVEALNVATQGRLVLRPSTVPAELANRVVIASEEPFRVHAADSSARRALGLGHAAALDAVPDPDALGERAAVTGPLPAGAAVDVLVPRRQAFEAPCNGDARELLAYAASASPQALQAAVVSEAGELVAHGSATTTGSDFEQVRVPLSSVAALARGQTYHVVVQGQASVFCDDAAAVSQAVGGALDGLWWKRASWTPGSGAMCLDLVSRRAGYVLHPPDVVVLTGEPYVLVRCPEIERELFRDRAFETMHAGLGLVKLANYGFREQRFDFSSFPPRRLVTPLGKLGKLTIRLERADGRLYDTKGVDHHLVLVLKYLEVTRGPGPGVGSTLNPSYQPDHMAYLRSVTAAARPQNFS